jgi:flagellar hook-length control protein FliK
MSLALPSGGAADGVPRPRTDAARTAGFDDGRGEAEFESILSRTDGDSSIVASEANEPETKRSEAESDRQSDGASNLPAFGAAPHFVGTNWAFSTTRFSARVSEASASSTAENSGGGERALLFRADEGMRPFAEGVKSPVPASGFPSTFVDLKGVAEEQSASLSQDAAYAASSAFASSEEAMSPVNATFADVDSRSEDAQPIGSIRVQSLETHLPVALSDLLAPQAKAMLASDETVSAAPTPSTISLPAEAPHKSGSATRLLTIELEPASLGAVIVKMKLSHSGVDMQISVASADALHALVSTRNALVDAMQSAGCSVDACTIRMSAAPVDNSQAPMDASSMGADAGARDRLTGGEGATNGGRDGEPRRESRGARREIAPDVATGRSGDRAGGVYL